MFFCFCFLFLHRLRQLSLASIATQLTTSFNPFELLRVSPIGDIKINQLMFGDTPPDISILNITKAGMFISKSSNLKAQKALEGNENFSF